MTLVPETTLTQLILLGFAFILSAIIGIERQRRLKSAGLRTHTLVGIGAALFTLVSAYGFAPVLGIEVTLDPSRIAAQVASGIGFIGAGVIFVRQNVVNGLTTAASIWVTAAIGVACGAGLPVLAAAAALLHLATVSILTVLGRRISTINQDRTVSIQYKEGREVLRHVLVAATKLGFDVRLANTRKIENSGKAPIVEAQLIFQRGRVSVDRLVAGLSEIKGVVGANTGADDD